MTGSPEKFHLSTNSLSAIRQIIACVKHNDLQPEDKEDNKKSIWREALKLFYKKRVEKVEEFLLDLGSKFEYQEDIFVFMIILLERCMTDGKPEEVKGPIALKYINSENAYCLLIVAAILAEKVLNDKPYVNYSYVLRYLNFFTNAQLNDMELIFLKKINWALNIESELFHYYAVLLSFDPYPESVIHVLTETDAKEIEDKLHEMESMPHNSDGVEEVVGSEYGAEYSPSPDYHNAPVVPQLAPTGLYPIHRITESLYTPALFKTSSPDSSPEGECVRIGIHPSTWMFGSK